jgi:hypothetical protein
MAKKTKQNEEIQNNYLEHYDEVKEKLLKIDNVVAVGIGLKEKDGQFTDEIAYKVFVPEKKSLAELNPNQVVPKSVKRLKTDVIHVYRPVDAVFVERIDLSEYRPIKGGIAISSSNTPGFYGTLGWFGTKTDGTKILLTNKHVLYDSTLSSDTHVYKVGQSQYEKSCCCECGVIGETIVGIKNNTVDCAVAKINTDINQSLIINNTKTNQVLRVDATLTATAVLGSHVRKIGARSSFTEGTVMHIGDTAVAPNDAGGTAFSIMPDQVLVIPTAGEVYEAENGKKTFANHGDSGSVVLNDSNQIVALLWGVDFTTNAVCATFANNINKVFAALNTAGVAIQLVASPAGGAPVADTRRTPAGITVRREGQLAFTPDGSISEESHPVLKMVKKHRHEVLSLINDNRPVKVAWQRLQGPAFSAHFMNSARDKTYVFPKKVKGISVQSFLINIGNELRKNGSDTLKQDLETYGYDLIAMAENYETVYDLLQHLSATEPVPET